MDNVSDETHVINDDFSTTNSRTVRKIRSEKRLTQLLLLAKITPAPRRCDDDDDDEEEEKKEEEEEEEEKEKKDEKEKEKNDDDDDDPGTPITNE
jgi:ABC-type Zn2+ transport system substrate-binding protein/surface adhesin